MRDRRRVRYTGHPVAAVIEPMRVLAAAEAEGAAEVLQHWVWHRGLDTVSLDLADAALARLVATGRHGHRLSRHDADLMRRVAAVLADPDTETTGLARRLAWLQTLDPDHAIVRGALALWPIRDGVPRGPVRREVARLLLQWPDRTVREQAIRLVGTVAG